MSHWNVSELDYARVTDELVDWLKERIAQAGARGAVVGLSGGIDSSVTAVLCQKAFGEDCLGVIMPCYSREKDAGDARLLAETFGIDYRDHDLGPVLNSFLLTLEEGVEGEGRVNTREGEDLAVANMKPRLRMITLYYYAACLNYLVVGTDNWSELKVGYFTKYGDGGVDLAPLGRLVKSEVRELARYLNVPDYIIDKAPSAGLWQGQTDEEEMGVSYQTLDRYILTGEAPEQAVKRIEELASRSAHKFSPIPIPDRGSLDDRV